MRDAFFEFSTFLPVLMQASENLLHMEAIPFMTAPTLTLVKKLDVDDESLLHILAEGCSWRDKDILLTVNTSLLIGIGRPFFVAFTNKHQYIATRFDVMRLKLCHLASPQATSIENSAASRTPAGVLSALHMSNMAFISSSVSARVSASRSHLKPLVDLIHI